MEMTEKMIDNKHEEIEKFHLQKEQEEAAKI
jgi:hypothetical protein